MRDDPLNKNGIMVVQVKGKQNLPLPYSILTELGIPTFVVFDGDAHIITLPPDRNDENDRKRQSKIDQGARIRGVPQHPPWKSS